MREVKSRIPPLSPDDVLAILNALPLVNLGYTDNPLQKQLNFTSVESAMNKFLNKSNQFSANELRVIFIGIGFAQDFLSGQVDGMFDDSAIDTEWRTDLSKYLFTYKRLYPLYENLILEIESQQKAHRQNKR